VSDILADVTRDGTLLFGEGYPDRGEDLFSLSPAGDVKPVRVSPGFSEVNGQFSPNARRWAYQSDESGRNEIYVEDYPGGGHRTVVSSEGGTNPVWSHDGRELFCIAGDSVMVAACEVDGTIRGRTKLFDSTAYYFWWHSYDPTPDGKRLLMIRREPGLGRRQLNVILNWTAELQRILPLAGK